jgi:hypothetical protein
VRPRFQQRHQDYVIGPNQIPALASVTANTTLTGIPFHLDEDAPFLLRGRAFRVRYDTSTSNHRQTGINQVQLRFTGPDQNFLATDPVPSNIDMAFAGQCGNFLRVYPQIPYPAGGTINLDIVNNGAATLTNLTFYFRGVKLYPWGVRPGYTYPPRFSSLPFVYPISPVTAANTQGVIQALGVAETRLKQPFTVKPDADFVLRAIQAGRSFTQVTWEIFLVMRDADGKAYSNDYVHLDVMAGSSGNPIQYPTGTGFLNGPIGAGASSPGLFFPEIYIPRNRVLQFDIQRADTPFVGQGAVTQDYPVNLIGAKVFPAKVSLQ